jgi:predicted type IV restriction endonuclease
MGFNDSIRELQSHIKEQIEYIRTEEATKTALVQPFLEVLGYDTNKITEVMPEFSIDNAGQKNERVDYAIMCDGKPRILIECKQYQSDLNKKDIAQLRSYFPWIEGAQFGILTNGTTYKFYTDLDKDNILDDEPFLELNMLKINDPARDPSVAELKHFYKSANLSDAHERARKLKYMKKIKTILIGSEEPDSENKGPSEELVEFFLHNLGVKASKNNKELFKQLIIDTFNQYIDNSIDSIIKKLRDNPVVPDTPIDPNESTRNYQSEAYYIIKTLLENEADPNQIISRDSENSFDILFNGPPETILCKLYLTETAKYLGIFDDNGKEHKIKIYTLNDINKYKDQIISQLPGKKWTEAELVEYLKGSAPYQRLFLAALVQSDEEPVKSKMVLSLMSQIAEKYKSNGIKEVISGKDIAGARSGLTRRAKYLGKEAILLSSVNTDDGEFIYKIKDIYKQIIIDWAKSENLWI